MSMFGSKKAVETNNNALTAPNSMALNSLVKGTIVEGTVSSESDIRIDGNIKGTLTCKAKVIVGPTGCLLYTSRCV